MVLALVDFIALLGTYTISIEVCIRQAPSGESLKNFEGGGWHC